MGQFLQEIANTLFQDLDDDNSDNKIIITSEITIIIE